MWRSADQDQDNDGYESVKMGFQEVKKEKRVDSPTKRASIKKLV